MLAHVALVSSVVHEHGHVVALPATYSGQTRAHLKIVGHHTHQLSRLCCNTHQQPSPNIAFCGSGRNAVPIICDEGSSCGAAEHCCTRTACDRKVRQPVLCASTLIALTLSIVLCCPRVVPRCRLPLISLPAVLC